MVKAIYLIKRKPGMELEAFRNYWLTTHASLALKVPGLRKYVQSHTLLSGYKRANRSSMGSPKSGTTIPTRCAGSPDFRKAGP